MKKQRLFLEEIGFNREGELQPSLILPRQKKFDETKGKGHIKTAISWQSGYQLINKNNENADIELMITGFAGEICTVDLMSLKTDIYREHMSIHLAHEFITGHAKNYKFECLTKFDFLKHYEKNKMLLDSNPQLQMQPTENTCVATSIAMAVGMDVKVVMEIMVSMGIDIEKGLEARQHQFFLSAHGIGYETGYNYVHTGILPGHYLVEVPSLNKTGVTHMVLLHITPDTALVLDPNNGKPGKNYYDVFGFDTLPCISFTALDDFADLKIHMDVMGQTLLKNLESEKGHGQERQNNEGDLVDNS